MEEEKIRLFVGGLGPEVSAGDLQERFATLGNVQSVALPPAKAGFGHRGFAYVDFVPATDASLRKLFSAYNGCKWRGGLLRIEKAKEDFTDRLHREWALEAASVTTDPPPKRVEAVQPSPLTNGWQRQAKAGNREDLEASDLKIFFPKLRKLKDVPLTGLGKHKRSFQRVESSPLKSLLTCACEESLRSGSCHCSDINAGTLSLKEEDVCRENDEIAQAHEIERQRQLELLNRLFPSDSTSTSSEDQKVVELDDSEGKGILEHQGTASGAEKTSSEQTLLPTETERVKQDRPTHSNDIERLVGEGHKEPLNSKLDSDNVESGFDDYPTPTAVARERAKQLELMHRLFPADAPSTREPEKVLQFDSSRAKKKQKLDASGNTRDLIEPLRDGPRDATIDHSVHSPGTFAQTNAEPQAAEHQELPMEQEQETRVSKSIQTIKSDDSLERASEIVLIQSDDSVHPAIAEDQKRQLLESITPVPEGVLSEDDSEMVLNIGHGSLSLAGVLSEDDSEMVLNVGDGSLSLAVAEEREKHELKSLSVRTSELLEKVSEMTRHITDDSLSLASGAERERQLLISSPDVMLEDEEMTLNLGDDSVPLSKAEEQEKTLVRNFALAKHYNWTGTDALSDPDDAEETDESETEEGDEEEDEEEEESSDGFSDSEEAGKAEDSDTEAEDSDMEDNPSQEQDDSSDSEEADQADGSESEEQYYSDGSSDADEAGEAQDNNETDSNPSEEQDDALHNDEYPALSPIGSTESKLAEAAQQRHEVESSLGKQSDESSKWAALANMCQFRGEEIMQSEERKPERSSAPVARGDEDVEKPSIQVQMDTSKAPSQPQTVDDENDTAKPEDPSPSGQKLTRAAWKSLVGETGRVVFSLRQLTGSSLPQTQVLTPETQPIEDSFTRVDHSVSAAKTFSQNQATTRVVAVRPAEKKHAVVRSSIAPKMHVAELTSTPVISVVSSGDVCPFMKSENAEKEWLASKSELRSDYRAKQKYAARNVKKLRGKR